MKVLNSLQLKIQYIIKSFDLAITADLQGLVLSSIIKLIKTPIPLAQVWIAKLIIDKVILYSNQTSLSPLNSLKSISLYLVIELCLIILDYFLGLFSEFTDANFENKLTFYCKKDVLEKSIILDLAYFEDPNSLNDLNDIRNNSIFGINQTIRSAINLLLQIVNLTSFIFVLTHIDFLVGTILVITAIPSFISRNKFNKLMFFNRLDRSEDYRKLTYYDELLTRGPSAKEVRALNIGQHLIQGYNDLYIKIFNKESFFRKKGAINSLIWNLASTCCFYVAYSWVIYITIQKQITLGDMTLYLALFKQTQSSIGTIFNSLNSLYSKTLDLEKYFNFIEMDIKLPDRKFVLDDNTPGVEFKNVFFRYKDDGSPWIIKGLNLTINPGEKIALVGENGAGKTTLIKLLMGLYRPNSGEVLINGVPTTQMSRSELKSKIGAIFQDFVKYNLTLRENIGLGDLAALQDEKSILLAAENSGADTILSDLPQGLDNILGTLFTNGKDLSGGQWQKIALARAFIQKGKILILDEPTASLDAKTESDIFTRFQELSKDKTTILVSHRFSTVKTADKIVVLENGEIKEVGSHSELMANQKIYFELFTLQAKGYLD
jgi:ATP-binding cassette subfamily B protein